MRCEQISFPSSDGKNNVVAYYFLPDEGQTLCGIVQLCRTEQNPVRAVERIYKLVSFFKYV